MSTTTTPAPPAPERTDGATGPDPRQLAADLERVVRPLPPDERRAVLARLVALAADPPANGRPEPPTATPPSDRPVEQLIAAEKEYPQPVWEDILADARWYQALWKTEAIEQYRGTHVLVYDGAVVANGNDTVRLQIEMARKYNVHPQRFILEYIPRRGEYF